MYDVTRPRISKEWTEAEVCSIRERLVAFNHQTAPSEAAARLEPLNLLVRDDADGVCGGLLGSLFLGVLRVDILWLEEELRGHGLGRRLLLLAEEEAREKGCRLIYLDTFSFQNPDFYLRQGYEIFSVLEGFSDGIQKFFLKKTLVPLPQEPKDIETESPFTG